MRTIAQHQELRMRMRRDPLEVVAALARSTMLDEYLVYENGGQWTFAGGCRAHIRLTRAQILAGTANPLLALEEFLATIPFRGWRVYGWAAFELAHAIAGRKDLSGDEDLLHLMVPRTEARITADGILLRAADENQLARMADLIDTPRAVDADPTLGIDIDLADSGGYRAAVAAAVAEIRSGALEKVILSRRVPVPVAVDLVSTYVAGRRANTPARSFLINLGRMRAAGFSPETVVTVSPDGWVATQPLAGTRARSGHEPQDARWRAELLTDPKEIYEHAISVKTAYDEIATLCGAARIEEFMAVRERGSVQHLASVVSGRLPANRGPLAAFCTLFPAVTATGVPKLPACQLIHSLENQPRGLYAGTVLTYDETGELDAALVLRSIFQHNGQTWLQAGAGIVAQAHPDREHEETCEKLRSVALHLRRPHPTTRWTPPAPATPSE